MIDIEGIVEQKTSAVRVEPLLSDDSSSFSGSKSSTVFLRICTVFCFLGFFTFIVVQFLNDVPEIKGIIAKANNKITDVKISENISFKSLAEIEPAAGNDDLDALLDWDSAPPVQGYVKKEVTPKAKSVRKTTRRVQQKEDVDNFAMDEVKSQPTVQDSKIQESLDDLAKQLAVIKANTSHINKDKFKALNNSVQSLTKRVIKMQSQMQLVNDKVAKLEKFVEDSKKNETKAAAVVKEESKKEVKSPWMLRSARKNMAWISHRGKDNLMSVSVGDNVEGLGKILEISKNANGRWLVKCEKGEIKQ